jgi:hypothetical protein
MSEVQTPQSHSSIQELQLARQELAERFALNNVKTIADQAAHVEPAIARVKNYGGSYDCPTLTPADLLGIEAAGFDINNIVSDTGPKSGKEFEVIAEHQYGEDNLTISRYADGVTFSLYPVNGNPPEKIKSSDIINAMLVERVERSPAHQAIKTGLEAMNEGSATVLNTPDFKGFEDPLGTAVALSSLGLLSPYGMARKMRTGMSASEALQDELKTLKVTGGRVESTQDGLIVSWGDSSIKTLRVDKESGDFKLSIEGNPDDYYVEHASTSNVKAIPFVETECAQELCDLLDSLNLMFHPKFQALMLNSSDKEMRYGGVYTEISREIAMMVNRPDNLNISSIIVPKNDKFTPAQLIEGHYNPQNIKYNYEVFEQQQAGDGVDVEQDVRNSLSGLTANYTGESAATIVGLISQLLDRADSGAIDSELPVSDQDVSMRDGSCFDVFFYYIGAINQNHMASQSVELKKVKVNDVAMLEKTYGKHTFLTTQPVRFNGVNLPKGSLMANDGNGGWVFSRLTPFAFDEPKDQLAMGSEVTAAYHAERETIEQIGGTTLEHINNAVY